MDSLGQKKIDTALENRIAVLAVKYFADKKEISVAQFNTDVLRENQIDYTEYVSTGKAPLKQFLMLFPNVLIVEEKDVNGTQYYCRLNYKSIKVMLLDIVRKNNGRILLASIQPELSRMYGVDYKEYSNGKSLLVWLKKDFGDIFAFDENYCILKGPMHDEIVNALTNLLQDNGGKLFLASVDPKLKSDYGINYKDYSKGLALQAWLKNNFSYAFVVDGDYLMLLKDVKAVSNGIQAEVVQLHAMAFMQWWANNTKVLQGYTGQIHTGDEWAAIVARGFSNALLGKTRLFCYEVENITKILFNTGINTLNGNALFCVLIPNPNNTTGELQPYAMEGFCCVAEEKTELSAEIKRHVPGVLKTKNNLDEKYEELRRDLEGLISYKEKAIEVIPDLTGKILDGMPIEEESFKFIKAYYDKWVHAKSVIDFIGWEDEAECELNISCLVNRLEYTNRKSDVFKNAVELFVNFAEGLAKYFEDCLCEQFRDVVNEDIASVKRMSSEHYEEFKQLLSVYAKLMELTEYNTITPEAGEILEFVNEHFNSFFTIYFFKLLLHKKTHEDMGVSSKNVPNEVSELLTQIDVMESTDENDEEVIVDCDELLNNVVEGLDAEVLPQYLLYVRGLCTTRLEAAIAAGDFDRCRVLIANGDMSIYRKNSAEMLSAIDEIATGEVTLTLYECGKRLLKVIGNYNQTAEKFFVVGLGIKSNECSQALLDLYINEDNTEKFYLVWNKYGQQLTFSTEKEKFLLHTLCSRGENVIREYLKKKIYVLYSEEYANLLLETLKEFGYAELLSECEKRVAYISSIPAINSFEEQILQMSSNNDLRKTVEYLASSFDILESYGYTNEECEKMSAALVSYESSEEQLAPIARLYNVQGAKNGTVERLAWNSLGEEYDEELCIILLKVLMDSARYGELLQLFECYKDSLIKNYKARELYTKTLVIMGDSRLYSFIKTNMQDCLSLLDKNVLSVNDFEQHVNASSDTVSEGVALLCKNVVEVAEYLDSPVLKSVIVLSDDLRDLAVNTGRLAGFGLTAQQIENFVSVYRTDSFPRGRDVLSLAERLYLFVGAHEATKKLALLALECGFDTTSLLWGIYSDTNDFEAKFDILSKNPEFRKGKEREYCSLLLQKNMYELFLAEVKELQSDDRELVVQTAIAKCKLGEDISNELEQLQKNISNISAENLNKLILAMVDKQMFDVAKTFVLEHFEEILSLYTANEIEAIVTANGTISQDDLKQMQKAAQENGTQKLVVYLYECFGIGRQKSASKSFIEDALNEYTRLPEEDKKQLLEHLRIIYSKNTEYAVSIVLREITEILALDSSAGEVCEKIENALDGAMLSADGVLSLIKFLKSYEISVTQKMSRSILSMCEENGIVEECVEFFHTTPSFFSIEDNYEVLKTLCEMYNTALSKNSFKESWVEGAVKVCAKLTGTESFYEAQYCLIDIQEQFGSETFAKFNLLTLLNKKQDIPAYMLPKIEAGAEKLHISSDTTIFDLFIEVAETSSLNDIVDYCEYCGNFIQDEEILRSYYYENFDNEEVDSYSEEACEVLVKLIYLYPEQGEYWRHCVNMPLEEHPVVYAKMLYKASLLNNKESLWKRCIDACERYSQEDLLMDVLIDCVTNIQIPYGLMGIRKALAERITKNPLYFSSLNTSRLTEFINILCKRMKEDVGVAGNHDALADLSIITIATNSEKAYSIMMEYAESYFFGGSCNLCFAVACRLILAKRFVEAKEIIERLSTIASLKYKKLISKLALMSVEELSAWSSENVNLQLMDMILPEGNYPNLAKIRGLTLSHSSPDKAETGALIISELLDNNPSDYGLRVALFMLCKQLPHRIDVLHKALCGLVENAPNGDNRSYYNRTQKDFAIKLANLDAVIMSQGINDQITAFDGYDFTKSAREFYQKSVGYITAVNDLNEIHNSYEKIEKALANRSKEGKDIIYKLVFGYVTGNWSAFIEKCWEKKESMSQYLEYYSESEIKMTQSILKVAYSLPEVEQNQFIEWIVGDKRFESAVYLYRNGYYKQVPNEILEADILDLPYDEYSLFEAVFKSTVSRVISEEPAAVRSCAMLVGFFSCSLEVMVELWRYAKKSFEVGNYSVAYMLYETLNAITRKEGICHLNTINNKFKPPEMYESLMRLSGAFAGVNEILEKISGPEFNPWSCINMVFALLYTTKANEVNRLRAYFSDENKRITDVILKIINKEISDDDKLEAVSELSDKKCQGIFYYIFRYRNQDSGQYAFLNSAASVKTAHERLKNIVIAIPGFFTEKMNPKHYIWIEPNKLNENAYEQLEIIVENQQIESEKTLVEVDEVSLKEAVLDGSKISLVFTLEPIEESEKSIEELWAEHEKIRPFDLKDYNQRLDIAKELYRTALGKGVDDKLLADYAIRYGVDYYYFCMGSKDYDSANKVIIELVNAFDSNSTLDGAQMLKIAVQHTALHELLLRGYASIRSMVMSYSENKTAFFKMRNMLPAEMSAEIKDVNSIYRALEIIGVCLQTVSESNTVAYRQELEKAGNELNAVKEQTNFGWTPVRHSVLQMIKKEINRIGRRAILSVDIINEETHSRVGCLHGQIRNIGNEAAENISFHINYDNSDSSIYGLSWLGKDEVAAFEVNYSVAAGTTQLNYEVIISYDSKGENYNNIVNGSLAVHEEEFTDFPLGLYHTDTPITDFELLEDGTVYSEEFYGRDEEKKKINAIFAGKSFSSYKNVIIKGIRRAGKTSMLNYLLKYVTYKCDDAIAVYIDCSGVKGGDAPIQRTLVDSVIEECRVLNVGNVDNATWDAFTQKWSLPNEKADCDANLLHLFYRELKQLNAGRGLMLVIDEFDVLIETVSKNQGVDSTLFPSLRGILNSPYCQDAIHLVICGSTKLIRYMDGGTLNQLFQQFGDNVIEIGRLLEKDMESMLTTPYKEHPEVKFTSLALDWIWKFTGGLVWYSKLVANCALNRAHSQKRSVVYPADIVDAVTTVTSNDDYFKSLRESCGAKDEIKILDVMQSLTAKGTEYVTVKQILEVLSEDLSQSDVENCLQTLERLHILTRNSFERYSYRFATELYWHYFRVSPSNYKRCDERAVIFKETKQYTSQYDAARFDM